jgi:hypothetical protein
MTRRQIWSLFSKTFADKKGAVIMVRRGFYWLMLVVGLVFLLSACGTQVPVSNNYDPLWTEARFGTYIQSLAQHVSTLQAASQNEALAALSAIPAGAPVQDLSTLANPESLWGSSATISALMKEFSVAGLLDWSSANNLGSNTITLPRGIWTFDGNYWVYDEDSKDLVLNFPFANLDGTTSKVTVQFIWDEYKPTLKVTDGTASYEVPTGLRIRSYTDTKKSGFIDVYADWYTSDCGTTLLEPSKLSIKGEFGYDGAIFVKFAVNISKKAGSPMLVATTNTGSTKAITIYTDGVVEASVDSGALQVATNTGSKRDVNKASWSNVFYGEETRGGNCVLTDLKINNGEIDFSTTFTLSGKTDTFQLRFTFDNVVPTSSSPSARLDGKIKVNGKIVVLFEGTLDATGNKLVLTFADGPMTLAEFIQKYLDNIKIDLGNLPLPTLPVVGLTP